jgi:hypothetical protein
MAAIGALVVLHSCGDASPRLPTAPFELTTGIVVYERADYLGESAHLTQDIRPLNSFAGGCTWTDDEGTSYSWDDCISSIRVAPRLERDAASRR